MTYSKELVGKNFSVIQIGLTGPSRKLTTVPIFVKIPNFNQAYMVLQACKQGGQQFSYFLKGWWGKSFSIGGFYPFLINDLV